MRLSFLLIFYLACTTIFAQQKKILIVGSNVATVNGSVNGTYLVEIAVPFYYFTRYGYEVDVVTPKGGKVAIYHGGDTSDALKPMALDKRFLAKTEHAFTPKQIDPKAYSAIIFPGGYGHFWDVLDDKDIAAITTSVYERGGVIGALGHGTADLLNVKLKNGSYLVKGKTLTCFPTWVEKEHMPQADYGKLLPVDMQSELRNRGAKVQVCEKNVQDCTFSRTTDAVNRLVTASFADSGEFIATEVHTLLQKQ